MTGIPASTAPNIVVLLSKERSSGARRPWWTSPETSAAVDALLQPVCGGSLSSMPLVTTLVGVGAERVPSSCQVLVVDVLRAERLGFWRLLATRAARLQTVYVVSTTSSQDLFETPPSDWWLEQPQPEAPRQESKTRIRIWTRQPQCPVRFLGRLCMSILYDLYLKRRWEVTQVASRTKTGRPPKVPTCYTDWALALDSEIESAMWCQDQSGLPAHAASHGDWKLCVRQRCPSTPLLRALNEAPALLVLLPNTPSRTDQKTDLAPYSVTHNQTVSLRPEHTPSEFCAVWSANTSAGEPLKCIDALVRALGTKHPMLVFFVMMRHTDAVLQLLLRGRYASHESG